MDIIAKLSEKSSLCNEFTIKEWWGIDLINGQIPAMVIWDEDGCFLISPNAVTYCDFSWGRTQKISRKIAQNKINWNLLQKLYLKGYSTGLFRTDLPGQRDLIDINGESWEFTETIRPGPGNGEIRPRDLISYDTAEQEFEGLYQILKAAMELSPTIPMIRFQSIRHDNLGFYFYTDWSDWCHPHEFVVENNLHDIKHYIRLNNWVDADSACEKIDQKLRSLL